MLVLFLSCYNHRNPKFGITVVWEVETGNNPVSPTRLLYNVWYGYKKSLPGADSMICLDGQPIATYRFEKNYYFMAGDNTASSLDSRYWGLLPETYIAGKAMNRRPKISVKQ